MNMLYCSSLCCSAFLQVMAVSISYNAIFAFYESDYIELYRVDPLADLASYAMYCWLFLAQMIMNVSVCVSI